MNARFAGLISLVLLGIVLVGINILAGAAFRSTRLDLTEAGLYTLTEGSRRIAKSPPEPVTLTFYYSERAAQGLPQVQSIAGRISELLDEFARHSQGKIVVRRVDPQAFSEEEDRAVQAGLVGLPARAGESIYLGLVATNTVGGREVIPLFDLGNERFLEYDVARIIQSLATTTKPVLTLLSSLQLDAGMTMDPQTGRPTQTRGWGFLRELRQTYDVRVLRGETVTIPPETSVLLVVHPKNLNASIQYTIDQWVLAGGRTMIFVDPLCESEQPTPDSPDPRLQDRSSNLESLFRAWGVEFDPSKVVGDSQLAARVFAGARGREQQIAFPPYLMIDARGLSRDDPATGKFSLFNIASAGTFALAPSAGATLTPIVQTTEQSQLLDARSLLMMNDPTQVLTGFKPDGVRRTVAARLTGTLKTAFPGGDPASAKPADETQQGPVAPADSGSLKQSSKPANVLLVADVDMLADRFWMREQTLGGVSLGVQKFAENADFVVTAADIFSGSGDLLTVRARGDFLRPFTRVEALRREAEAKYRAEQEELETKLREAEARISEIQRQRSDTPTTGAIVLTDEQKKEIEGFLAQKVETRRQLRQVQFNLRRDVEELGAWIKVVNIAGVPVVMIGIAAVWALVRSVRRRAGTRA